MLQRKLMPPSPPSSGRTSRSFFPLALLLALPLSCTGVVGDGSGSGPGDKPGPTKPPGTAGSGAGASMGAGGSGGPATMPPAPVGAPATSTAIPACTGEEQPGPRRLRLLTRSEYAHTVTDLLSIPAPAVDNLPVETVVDGFDNNASAGAVTSRHIDEYLALGERLAAQAIMVSRWKLATCPAGNGCDRTFVTTFGRRAFRRPLTEAEITRHLALFDPAITGGSFEKGMELAIRAMLSAPSFLYRSELGEKAPDGTYKLSQYEVATALSYFFWGTTPDDMLLEAARAGTLATPQGIEAQAMRLLADARSKPAVAAFFRQWLGTDGFLFTNKDAAIYPKFTDPVRKAMVEELDAFATNVVFSGTGKLPELFTADYVFVNQALGGFYGLAGAGATMGKVPVTMPERNRGGLLTLGAVLGAHAHPNESSPVRRGLFVRSRLLCQTLPPPPPGLDITPPGLDPTLTTRDRFAKHASDAACATCHKLIDPLGFGFERYDGVGDYRAVEHGKPVDARGEVLGLEDMNDGKVTPFNGLGELGRILSESPNAQACFARQLFRYARGGENGPADACAISRLQSAFKESGHDIKRLLVEVVKGKSFLTRN